MITPVTGPGASAVAGVILCGGRARRLGGRHKALIEVGGRTVLARQLAVLAPRLATVAISANDPEPFRAAGLPVLADRIADQGPLAGLAAALTWSPAPHLLAVAGDMPYLVPAVVDLVLAGCEPGVDIVMPFVGGLPEPLLALYGRACLDPIERRLAGGQRRTAGLLDEPGLSVRRIEESALRAVDPALHSFVNLNTCADLETLGQRGEPR
ncbi:molybdenum cofactor guanylyltransferase [Haliangium sp.]|uniref:molybdenum cofactor guanylyltransferase n=1 Tax=Haliangium sp. TaxID=2663208 RepID=UPI003D098742